jgi:hypothetical protein
VTKRGILGSGMTLDSVMCLVLAGFGIALLVPAVINGGIWLLLLLPGLLLLGLGVVGLVLAMRNRL